MIDTHNCKHGYPLRFWQSKKDCGYDQPDGATLTEAICLDTFITGGRTVYLIPAVANKRALIGRTISIDGIERQVVSVESCLIPGHDTGHCSCFKATGVLVKE